MVKDELVHYNQRNLLINYEKKIVNRINKNKNSKIFFSGTFDNDMQQDAHEFLNHLLNTCGDILLGM